MLFVETGFQLVLLSRIRSVFSPNIVRRACRGRTNYPVEKQGGEKQFFLTNKQVLDAQFYGMGMYKFISNKRVLLLLFFSKND